MEPTTAPPPMPQNTVVVNGAAVNLITNLIEGVRADMRDLRKDVSARVDAHDEVHREIRERMREVQDDILDSIEELRGNHRAADEAVRVAKAKREGQLEIVNAAGRFWDRYNKWILTGAGILLGFAANVAANIRVTIGS